MLPHLTLPALRHAVKCWRAIFTSWIVFLPFPNTLQRMSPAFTALTVTTERYSIVWSVMLSVVSCLVSVHPFLLLRNIVSISTRTRETQLINLNFLVSFIYFFRIVVCDLLDSELNFEIIGLECVWSEQRWRKNGENFKMHNELKENSRAKWTEIGSKHRKNDLAHTIQTSPKKLCSWEACQNGLFAKNEIVNEADRINSPQTRNEYMHGLT